MISTPRSSRPARHGPSRRVRSPATHERAMSQPRRPMRRVGDLLPGLATSLGLEEQLSQALAISSWERLVAELVPPAAGASRLLEVRPPELLVSADDPMTGQELRLNADL